MALRIVLMGTGEFALPSFQTLIQSPHNIVGLVTQPDRTGRGHHRHVNKLKEFALSTDIPVFQPEKVNQPESLATLEDWKADLFVIAAYGQILSKKLLSIPRLGAINIHGSLLPKFRGAAPVQFAVLTGEAETGVSIFRIEPKLDSGPLLGTVATEIGSEETSGELHDRLAILAAPLTLDVVNQLDTGTAQETNQDPDLVTFAPKIEKAQGWIDWTRKSEEIGWHVRGMQPWPMPVTMFQRPEKADLRVSILRVQPIREDDHGHLTSLNPGELRIIDDRLLVKTGDSGLEVLELQPAGKRPMPSDAFARGNDLTDARFIKPDA
ncbi:Methionyl-tRNA formyltransferase [Thalassoglobus neptunius]|uniref:Methionyl-tRNA formyltransferase n=1 Tax=Thalassoglobus neptunius TaxID=1938619 RepID=A0A5C5WXC8_9PLAN|nr:methionyl-tRNA formyltransferase [Thalassoglobus neptunius]TWT55614.1 Methionyl-tRNA formyltransferase [Thalassoglobus neptunius]